MTLFRPSTPAGAEAFRALLDAPGRALLALDFDGVLAPIVADPTQSRPHPDVIATLGRLAPHLAAVAVVTGRPAGTAVDYAGLAGAPGLDRLVVLGHYGAERWEARSGQVEAQPVPPGVAAVRDALPGLFAELRLADETHIEDKGRSLAVHTRRAANPDTALAAIRGPLAELADQHGLVVEPGRFVVELRPPGVDKGDALRGLASEYDATIVAYAGDDLGDLPAFAAIDALRSDDVLGLKVCSGSAEVTELSEQADLIVDGPDGVVELLRHIADELDRRRPARRPD